jgi:methylmalonyl-CoA/ethylmalonyl-CoA epimerase
MTAFFKTGDTKIELLEALSEQSPIHRYIARHGEGMHHIAYLVDDIRAEMDRLRAQGYTLLQEAPKEGADHKWVCFLHPKGCQGVLTELCQERQ